MCNKNMYANLVILATPVRVYWSSGCTIGPFLVTSLIGVTLVKCLIFKSVFSRQCCQENTEFNKNFIVIIKKSNSKSKMQKTNTFLFLRKVRLTIISPKKSPKRSLEGSLD